MIVDGDSHLYEPRDVWRQHTSRADAEAALYIEEDELGFAWLMLRGASTGRPAWVAFPNGADFVHLGEGSRRYLAGLPNPLPPYDDMPADFWEPGARCRRLDDWGIDETVLFPQWGFQWERPLAGDAHATKVNMAAWNRWAIAVAQDGRGRLHPVGHVRLEIDHRWLAEQLAVLAAGGVRLAMFSPGLVEGRRLSHPDLAPIWELFVEHGISPTWHVNAQMQTVLADSEAWAANERGNVGRVVTGLFARTAAELALCDLAVNGVFERHPELRVVIAELGADWFPALCRRIDSQHRIVYEMSGSPSALRDTPSEYLRRQVRVVCSFPSDADVDLIHSYTHNVAFGGDYPHVEGLADPLREYQQMVGPLEASMAERFYGANLEQILHR